MFLKNASCLIMFNKKLLGKFYFLTVLIIIGCSGIVSEVVNAQASSIISIQGKIVQQSTGINIDSTLFTCISLGADSCDFRVSIYDDNTGVATLLWRETHLNIEIGDTEGIFSLRLNSICNSWDSPTTPCSGSGIDWGSDPTLYIQIDVDTDGDGDFVTGLQSFPNTPANRPLLTSVPFAYYSDYSGGVVGGLDTVYANDSDKILNVNNTLGLEFRSTNSGDIIFNMQSTGNILFQDNNSTFLTLSNIGGFEYILDSTDNPDFIINNLGSGVFRINDEASDTTPFIVDSNGLVSISTTTNTAFLNIAQSSSARASLRLISSSGTDPSSPNSGDLWWNGTSLNFRTASSTIDLLTEGSVRWNNILDPTSNLTLSMGTNTTVFNFANTSSTGFTLNSNSLTTGNAFSINSNSTDGSSSGSSILLNLSRSGTNSNSSHTAYGIFSDVTNTGTTSTNISGYFSATGASTNYALLTENGNSWFKNHVGIGSTAPSSTVGLRNNHTFAISDANLRGILSTTTATGNNSEVIFGIDARVTSSPGVGNVQDELLGMASFVLQSGAGTVNLAYGFKTFAQFSDTVVEYRALDVTTPLITGGTTFTNNYGIYVQDLNTGTNSYGVYVGGARTYSLWIDQGTSRLDGRILASFDSTPTIFPSIADPIYSFGGYTYNDGFSSGTVSEFGNFTILPPTLTSTSSTTVTNAATFVIQGSPIAGTNNTITNSWGLIVASGLTRLGGNTIIGSSDIPNARLSVSTAAPLTGSASSNIFNVFGGALGGTAGNTIKLTSIGFGASANQVSLGIEAKRLSSGSDWTTTAIGLKYDVDGSSPVNNSQLWFTSSGKLGFGTDSPVSRLQINATSIIDGINSVNTSTGGGGLAARTSSFPTGADVRMGGFLIGPQVNATDYTPIGIFGFSAESQSATNLGSYLTFEVTAVGSNTRSEAMRIASTRNIGIGTTTTTHRLNVETDSASGYVASFFNDGDNVNRYGIRIQAGADNCSTTGTCNYVDVFDGDGTAVGGLRSVNGTVAVWSVSDQRTKTEITTSNFSATNLINGIRIVDFRRATGGSIGPLQTGFLAQQLLEVFPDMVSTDRFGLLTISTEPLIPVLVKGIQEQQAQIKIFQDNINNFSGNLSNIQDQLNILQPQSVDLQSELFSTKTSVSILQQNISDLTNELNTLRNQILGLQNSTSISQIITDLASNVIPELNIFKMDVTDIISSNKIRVTTELILPSSYAGKVNIPQNTQEIQINFVSPFSKTPVVTATLSSLSALNNDFRYIVFNENPSGFSLRLDKLLTEDITINWSATLVE